MVYVVWDLGECGDALRLVGEGLVGMAIQQRADQVVMGDGFANTGGHACLRHIEAVFGLLFDM